MKDLNLIPREKTSNVITYNQKVMIVALSMIVVMTAIYFAIDLFDQSVIDEIEEFKKETSLYQGRESQEKSLAQMKEEINIITSTIEDVNTKNTNQLDLLKGIEGCIPEGISFTEQLSSEGVMYIKGVAKNEDNVSQFAAKLHELQVKDIWINTTEFDEEIRFEVSFVYNENGGTEK